MVFSYKYVSKLLLFRFRELYHLPSHMVMDFVDAMKAAGLENHSSIPMQIQVIAIIVYVYIQNTI